LPWTPSSDGPSLTYLGRQKDWAGSAGSQQEPQGGPSRNRLPSGPGSDWWLAYAGDVLLALSDAALSTIVVG